MMSFVNFETMRRRRVLWRRGGAPVGGAASGNELPDALRRSGTPCCSIGLARGPGSTWVLAETRARRAGKSPAPTCLVGTGAAAAGIVTWLPSLAIARGDKWALWAVTGGHPLRGHGRGQGPVGRRRQHASGVESGGAGHPAVGGAHSEQCSPECLYILNPLGL